VSFALGAVWREAGPIEAQPAEIERAPHLQLGFPEQGLVRKIQDTRRMAFQPVQAQLLVVLAVCGHRVEVVRAPASTGLPAWATHAPGARASHCRMRTTCALRSPSMPSCMAVKPGL